MDATELCHAGLGVTVKVPASTARVLRRNGWGDIAVDPGNPAADIAPPDEGTPEPDSTPED
jgi:hypothetical protein